MRLLIRMRTCVKTLRAHLFTVFSKVNKYLLVRAIARFHFKFEMCSKFIEAMSIELENHLRVVLESESQTVAKKGELMLQCREVLGNRLFMGHNSDHGFQPEWLVLTLNSKEVKLTPNSPPPFIDGKKLGCLNEPTRKKKNIFK